MWMCIWQMKENGYQVVDDDVIEFFSDLLRAPRAIRHITRQTSKTFVSGLMPWLNNYLWDHPDANLDVFIPKLSASRYSIEVKSQQVKDDKNAKLRMTRRDKQTKIVNPIDGDTDWGTVKAVRSAVGTHKHRG